MALSLLFLCIASLNLILFETFILFRRGLFLSLEEEEKIMESVRSKALQGKILTAKDIICALEKNLKKKVSDDYVWDLL